MHPARAKQRKNTHFPAGRDTKIFQQYIVSSKREEHTATNHNSKERPQKGTIHHQRNTHACKMINQTKARPRSAPLLSIQTGEKKPTQPSTKGTNTPNETSDHSGTSTSICGHCEGTKNRNLNTAPPLPNLPVAPPSTKGKSKKRNGIKASLHIKQQTIAFRIQQTPNSTIYTINPMEPRTTSMRIGWSSPSPLKQQGHSSKHPQILRRLQQED
ncbi:hypothetical protein Nepgr_023025 [Nepenthes gracilis]|uniref:Uncharacterized protein n=1 Tax=Nepenthes gracilis TaxID=150966 RepID=A0AAD3T002_NEPGR|nr:hypothetical protein Nepgr_023025 [Nepenthes gracilis]